MNDNADPSEQAHVVLGTGPLGRATASALALAGKNTVLVNRSGKMDQVSGRSTLLAGDLDDPRSLASTLPPTASIYFCVQPPYHRWPQEFPALQASAIAIAEALEAKLIVAENLYGYGPVEMPMVEDMPLRPNTRKGSVRAAMHEALMKVHTCGAVQVAVARGSDFFGPYVDGSAAGARAFKAVVDGNSVNYIGNLDLLHSYTFVDDFGRAMATLGSDERALGQVWHVPSAAAVSTRTFFETALEIAGSAPKFRKVGLNEMRLLGLIIPPMREMIEMAYQFDRPFVIDDAKFRTTFGGVPTPLREALTRTIHWAKRERQSQRV